MSYLTKRQMLLRPVMDKKQQIENAISDVKARREHEELLLDGVSTELEQKRTEIAEISTALDSVDETLGLLSAEHLQYVSDLRNGLVAAESILGGFIEVLHNLDGKVAQAQGKLESLEADAAEVRTRIAAEGKVLSRRKEDLDIYRSRLDKAAKEHGLDIKILL